MDKISIVVSTYKRESYLNQLISSIEKYFPDNSYEVIIVSSDNPNSDKIKNILTHKNVKVITPDFRINERLHSLYYYENMGIKECGDNWIFITNDDTKFINNFYDNFLTVKDQYDVILVGGHIGDRGNGIRIPITGSFSKPNCINNALYLFDFSLIKKEKYKEIGYIDENMDWYGKGADLSLQIEFLTNSRILYNSNLVIDHEIAIENRTSMGYVKDFSYITEKWEKWCKNNQGYSFNWKWK